MRKKLLNIFFICFLTFLFLGLDSLKVFAQTSQSIYIAPNKTNFLLGENICIGISDLPGIESGTSTKVKLYADGPNSECKDGCEKDLFFTRSLFANNALCMTFTDKDVGSWNAYIEYNGIKSNTINYTVGNQLSITNATNSGFAQGSQREIVFTANDSKDLTVYVNNMITYDFQADTRGVQVDSWYTADQPDSCPGGISKANEIKPWVMSGFAPTSLITAQVQPCQEGRIYTITVALRDAITGNILGSSSITVRVKKSGEQSSSFCSNIQENKTYTLEEIQNIFSPIIWAEYRSCDIQRQNAADIYNPKTNYYSPSGDPTGIPPGNLYKADHYSTSFDKQGNIQRVKVGSAYLCSYSVGKLALLFGAPWSGEYCLPGFDRGFNTDYCAGNDLGQITQYIKSTCGKSINISSISNPLLPAPSQNPPVSGITASQTSTSKSQSSSTFNIHQNVYNPLDVSFYTGPTTIPGVTDKTRTTTTNQTSTQPQNQGTPSNISVINSLVDTLAKLTSILDSAKNLNAQAQQSIIQALQAVVDGIKNIISKL
jgi:hypothetical protein